MGLEIFSAPVREWFAAAFPAPTRAQELAWPRIAAGAHVLVTAPTGSGKTLTAFLWALDRLLSDSWDGGQVRVLYVSPLRALGTDIRRNLLAPLAELEPRFADGTSRRPRVRVEVRSGDTPAEDRRRMLRSPPEILVTTPESLNILLTSRRGRELLCGLRTVILDEVHAVAASKRGVHLITAVERLVRLSGEVQRLALSATVRPAGRVAEWVGGFRLEGDDIAPTYRPRPVEVVDAGEAKRYDLAVAFAGPAPDKGSAWEPVASRLRSAALRNRSTLIFANSRRTVEKVARLVNEQGGDQLAWSHHGSLSREIRQIVEERLKAGQLRAIVATSSLELGIDVGAVDEVALVGCPTSVMSAVQRLGRAGHRVGEVSRGRLYPLFGRDLLQAGVLARAVVEGEIEEVRPVGAALDVLAQVVLSMAVAETWTVERLHAFLRTTWPYHRLTRRQLDLVLDLLTGRWASTRLRTLRPLIALDRVDGTLRARPGAEQLLYMAGGTIPDRGYFRLRLEGSGDALGELDEEFVWERSIGDTFTLGVQTWRIQRVTHNDVFVTPAGARSAMAPFWRADERDRSLHLSERVAALLELVEPRLGDEELGSELAERLLLERDAATELVRYLAAQKAATQALPHRHRVVVEQTAGPAGRSDHVQLVLHTLWGGRVNRPLACALSAAWEERFGLRPEVVHDDDCVVLTVPSPAPLQDPLELVTSSSLELNLRASLERTGFFGARFREAAGVALALPRAGLRRRTPLWVTRARAKELLDAVGASGDFPLVLEAWRACLEDEMEVEALARLLDEVANGTIEVRRVRTEAPSPFATGALWKQTSSLMYEDDVPTAVRGPRLDEELLREVALSGRLRPRLDKALVARFGAKLRRTSPGYAPTDPSELLEWVKERLAIPLDEWRELLDAVRRDAGADPRELVAEVSDRLAAVVLPNREMPSLVAAVEQLPRLLRATGRGRDQVSLLRATLDGLPVDGAGAALALLPDLDDEADPEAALPGLLADWLRFYGPVRPSEIARAFDLPDAEVAEALTALAQGQQVVLDELTAGAAGVEVCDRENLERLLRSARAEARTVLEARPLDELPLFLAVQQGLATDQAGLTELETALEALFGCPAPAESWETELLPARLEPYLPSWMDTLLAETGLEWIGCGPRRLAFALADDRELFVEPEGEDVPADHLLPSPSGRFPFPDLLAHTSLPSAELAARLWQEAWAGRVTSDVFAPVRTGARSGFRPTALDDRASARHSRRGRFDRWRGSRPFAGAWFRPRPVAAPSDPLEAEELNRDRVRVLLDRYGVLFRELLERELPMLRWRALVRTLRVMELGGEVIGGRYFAGVPGLQFASPAAVRRLEQGLPTDRVFWLNAVDPASPCGLGLDGFSFPLPRRTPGNHLVFHGSRLVVTSEGSGRRLTISVGPDHPHLLDYLGFLKVQLGRSERPRAAVVVETVNGEPAATSPYRPVLAEVAAVSRSPGGALRLGRRYTS